MNRLHAIILLLCLLAAPLRAQDEALPPFVSPGVLELEMRPGEKRRFRFQPSTNGEGAYWLSSERGDPVLTLLNRKLVPVIESDDEGGGTTAQILNWIATDHLWTFEVRLKDAPEGDPQGPITVRFGVVETGVTPATAERAERVSATAEEMQRLLAAKDWAGARARARKELEEPLPPPEAVSWGLSSALYRLGLQAAMAEDHELAAIPWRLVHAVWERILPETNADLQDIREYYGNALARLGDPEAARDLQERALAVRERTSPADDISLQFARMNFASTLSSLGDEVAARRMQESALRGMQKALPEDHHAIQQLRINLSGTLRDLGDLAGSLELQEEVFDIWDGAISEHHPDLMRLHASHASTLEAMGEFATARDHRERVVAIVTRIQGATHMATLSSRITLAATIQASGDLAGALSALEQTLATAEEHLPTNHPTILRCRVELSDVVRDLGDLERARDLGASVLAVWERTLPEDDEALHSARQNHAATLESLGDLDGARVLHEKLLAVSKKHLPQNHITNQGQRLNVSAMLQKIGDLPAALEMQRGILEQWERTLPEGHPHLQAARAQRAKILWELGDLEGAHVLYERVLEVFRRTLSDDHPNVISSLGSLAASLQGIGRLAEARACHEEVLAARERSLPIDHPRTLSARMSYAALLKNLGDFAAAQTLEESVLAAYERTLAPDHPDLQRIRLQYAHTLRDTGHPEEALVLQRKVLEVRERTLDEGHHRLRRIRMNLAATLLNLGDLDGAREQFEIVHAVERRILDENHPSRLATAGCIASVMRSSGDYEAAKKLEEPLLRAQEAVLPADHDNLRAIRINHAWTLHCLEVGGDITVKPGLHDVLTEFLVSARRTVRRRALSTSRRQAALTAADRRQELELALSFAPPGAKDGAVDRAAFLLAETLGESGLVGLRTGAFATQAEGEDAERLAACRYELAHASGSLAGFIAEPRLPPGAPEDQTIGARLAHLVLEKEKAERALTSALRELPGAGSFLDEIDIEDIAAALPTGAAGVSYVTFRKWDLVDGQWNDDVHLSAFVLARDGALRRIELGPVEPMRRLIERLRTVDDDTTPLLRELGRSLWSPVAATMEELPARLVVAIPSALAFVPLDALVLDDGVLLGDRMALDVVPGLSWIAREEPADLDTSGLLALGGAAYGAHAEDRETVSRARPPAAGDRIFAGLPFTAVEVGRVAGLFSEVFGAEVPVHLLKGERADSTALRTLAPGTRFVHLATHGWFAPESVPSLVERRAGDRSMGIVRDDLRRQVTGYEPLALCGLALAKANAAAEGFLNGAEIAALDLSGCELAVLSACETGLGIERAGQGLASLREALFLAGARASVTSLWAVPDEATMELMTAFYEGLWRRRETRREALWNAKAKLRAMKRADGSPKYSLVDWAGWVLVGRPQ